MAWISGGALVAGTAPDQLPRIADEEMPGEQVILKGFYIDVHPYPNEEGAIPLSNVTQAEAQALCAEAGKRLCSELEWERACKGPDNHIYEYGDAYRSDRCGTGSAAALRPSGLRVACRSEFGVRDMHGGIWEWTDSPWGRGTNSALVALRGGNSTTGELVGRCANAISRRPDDKSGTIGFRCCSGPRNPAEVVLSIRRGQKLELRERVDRRLAQELIRLVPDSAEVDPKSFVADRMWLWRPIANDELVAMNGCSGIARDPRCGVLVARLSLDRPKVLVWASSGRRLPSLHAEKDARAVWLLSVDYQGRFTRRIGYAYGQVSAGPIERRVPDPPKPTRRKRR
jgi:hypothetical protein